jgi:hypothetical protein
MRSIHWTPGSARPPAATIQRYDSMKACSDPIHQELRLLRNCILFTINLILNNF